MFIRRFVRFLEEHLKLKFPDLKINLYSNRKNKLVPMVTDFSLFSVENFQEIILKIESFERRT